MEALDDGDVQRLCLDLQGRFDWESRSDAYDVVERWSSRTSDFYLCEGRSSVQPVLVKVLTRERRADPGGSFETLRVMDAMYKQAASIGARPPQALGWSSTPAALAMEYVRGHDAGTALRRSVAARDDDEVQRLARRCGATLGAWHGWWGMSSTCVPDHAVLERLGRPARRLGLRLDTIVPTGTPVHLAYRFRDLGIYNFACTDEGEVVVLDPPPSATRDLDVAARDIGWFLASIASTLSRDVATSRLAAGRHPSRYLEVRRSILRHFDLGYERAAGVRLREADLRLTALLETSYLVARAASRWRTAPRQALFLARVARATRSLARRAGRQADVIRDRYREQ